jgi:uncharacterized protein YndB with AHSA1/START domain
MEKIAIESTIFINASRAKVWHALTSQEQLNKWWKPNRWEISSLETGATIKFFDTETDIFLVILEVVEPPQQLTLRWQRNHWYPVDTLTTTFVLTEEDLGTRVTVTNSGFEALPEAIRQSRIDGGKAGYDYELDHLKAYLEGQSA